MPTNEDSLPSTWVDPDEAPPWTPEIFARAELRIGEKVIRPATGTLTKPGRPRLAAPKRQLTIRLDQAVLDHFRATGAGWQARINDILRREAGV